MKKSMLIIGLVLGAFTISVFALNNRTDISPGQDASVDCGTSVSDDLARQAIIGSPAVTISFDVASRYQRTVTKKDLSKARSFLDLFPKDRTLSLVSCSSLQLTVLDDWRETDVREDGDNEVFNSAQLNLLRSLDYSSNLLINAQYKGMNTETGQLEDGYTTPRMTIVPEQVALPPGGKEALLAYTKKQMSEFTYLVARSTLRDGKVRFTVTQEGQVVDISLISKSGYPAMDEKMLNLIATMPGSWSPAANTNGENVAQEFVFFFGTMGC